MKTELGKYYSTKAQRGLVMDLEDGLLSEEEVRSALLALRSHDKLITINAELLAGIKELLQMLDAAGSPLYASKTAYKYRELIAKAETILTTTNQTTK